MQLVTFEARADRSAEDANNHRSLSDGALGFEGLDFGWPGRNRLGALIPSGPRQGDVVDLDRALAVKLAYEDVGAPEVEADSLLPARLLDLLQHGESAMVLARDCLTFALEALNRYDGPDLVRAGVVIPRKGVSLRAPIPRPGKVIGGTRP